MRIAVAILCAALAAGCETSPAPDELADDARAGEVLAADGTVTARAPGGEPRPLVAGAAVLAGDTVETAAASSVRIRLDHNSAVLDLGAGKSVVLRASAAWRAAPVRGGTFDQTGRDKTAVAGREGEREAADTSATGARPSMDEGAPGAPDKAAARKPEAVPEPPKTSTRSDADDKRKRAPQPPPPPTTGPACDEVACLLDPDRPCCRKFEKRKGAGDKSSGRLADKPSASQVRASLGAIQASVRACVEKHGGETELVLRARVTVAPSGRVTSVEIPGDGTQLSDCLVAAFKKVRFPASKKGLTFRYPVRGP